MASRAEITTKYARAYKQASKKDKGRVLDQVVGVTGWSRDDARRRLVAAAKKPPGAGRQVTRGQRWQRADKFSYHTRVILAVVWAATAGQCGKYLTLANLVRTVGVR